MVLSFLCFLLAFTLIGVSSYFKSRHTGKDYYLASSSVKPWLVGLSAVATNNSGYMFIGVIGYTYATGFGAVWLMLGWITGDFIASTFVHKRLRKATLRTGAVSYAGVLSAWYGDKNNQLQRLIGIASLLFLLAYAGAQLVAGSKALEVLFDWPAWAGASVGAAMVALYCLAGGIRASIWTDAAQSFVMFFSMMLLLIFALNELGGFAQVFQDLDQIDGYLHWVPNDIVIPGIAGGVLYVVGWLFAGFSVIGQPHIMVRFMALDHDGGMRTARIWYYSWFLIFYCMATAVGLLSRIYLPEVATFDAELALPTMAQQLFPPVLVGLILAGIFAATMSTADSLILSCSAAITHDVLPFKIQRTWLLKAATLVITLGALGWALLNSQSVFDLVIMSWSALASGFAPLLMVLCFGWRPSQGSAIAALLLGLGTAILWRYFGLHLAVYEGLPGILVGLAALTIAHYAIEDRSKNPTEHLGASEEQNKQA